MAMGLMIATTVNAQEEPKVSIKPTGRILLDAAYVKPQEEEDKLKSGAAIPDFRVGDRFSYDKWKAKIDVGYAYGKIGMKDVIVEYGFNKKNFLRGGYFIHQYGFQSSTSSSFKETMEERLPDTFMRIHRSYIINLTKIQEVNKNRVIMDTDTYLPIGDMYKDNFLSYLNTKFLGK